MTPYTLTPRTEILLPDGRWVKARGTILHNDEDVTFAERITPDHPPQFPCWLLAKPTFNAAQEPYRWVYFEKDPRDIFANAFKYCSHWHPDQPAATEQQRKDGERLDWLASDKRSMEELHTIMAYQGKYMREEIDAAMSKEESP